MFLPAAQMVQAVLGGVTAITGLIEKGHGELGDWTYEHALRSLEEGIG